MPLAAVRARPTMTPMRVASLLASLGPVPTTPSASTQPQPSFDPHALGPGLVSLGVLALVVLALIYLVVKAPRRERPDPSFRYRPEPPPRAEPRAVPRAAVEPEAYVRIPRARVVRRDRRRDPT